MDICPLARADPGASRPNPVVPSLPFPRLQETQSRTIKLLRIFPCFPVPCTVIIASHGRQISDRGREGSREVLALLSVMVGSFPGGTEVGH